MINLNDNPNLPYRKLMCAVIEQAIDYVKGEKLCYLLHYENKNYEVRRLEEIKKAKEYIASIGFREDCDLLGLDAWIIRKELSKPKGGYVLENSRQKIERVQMKLEMA